MVTSELLEFLRAQLATGMTPQELERVLVEEGGWDKSDVEEGIIQIGQTEVESVPEIVASSASVASMDIATNPISLPDLEAVTDEVVQEEGERSSAEPVTLSVRSLRDVPPAAETDDFLGIFSGASTPIVASPLPEEPTQEVETLLAPTENVEVAEALIHVDVPQIAIVPAQAQEKKETHPTVNLMEMLAPVSTPVVSDSTPVQPAEGVKPAVVKFDLSRIKPALAATSPQPPAQAESTPEPLQNRQSELPSTSTAPQVGAGTTSTPLDKPIETRSVAELWLSQGKVVEQPAQNEEKEIALRASLSSRRTMTSDVLLRGRGATIKGLPALLPAEDANPMPVYASAAAVESKKAAEKKIPQVKQKLTQAEELTRKNKIKKTIGFAALALVLVTLVALAAVVFIKMRGPDVATLLTKTIGNFVAAPSFAYSGVASSDLVLTSKTGGENRSGVIKFNLDYSGSLKSDKYGYGDGNHRIKWAGGLSSGNFSWSTDIESDVRIVGTNLYFRVLAFPVQAEIDPDLFKTYWIKVDVAEIAKELALETVTSSEDYNGIAGSESSSFIAVLSKDLPFTGGEKVGSEKINNTDTTHFTLKNDPEKMFVFASDLYKKYLGKSFLFNKEEKIRFVNALEKLKFEIWVDEKTSALVKLSISADLDDDIGEVRVKGPFALGFVFANFGTAVTVKDPAPYLSLDELRTRMDDFKKFKLLRTRDATSINGLGEVEHALGSYMSTKGRFPITLSELRVNNFLSTSTLAEEILKTYVYAPYQKSGDFTKANKCLLKSKTCSVYHLGVNLNDTTNPALQNDSDQNSDVRGDDKSGCALEREKACYDIVFVQPTTTVATTTSKVP